MANNDFDTEDIDQEQGSGQSKTKRGGNFGYNAANDLNNFAGKATNVGNKLGEKAASKTELAAKSTGERAVKVAEQAKKLKNASEKALKMAEKARKFAEIATKIGKIISVAGLIILIIMIVIGLIVFLITGWGMILSGFKEIGQKFWDTCYDTLFGGENNVKDDEIINLIDNIETMGYDLYGYGFVSSMHLDGDGNKIYYEEENGNKKLIENLENKDAYRYLTTYLISDNYAYYIKNNNFNFRSMTTKFKSFFGGIFDNTDWGSGLISIYVQAGGSDEITGIRGDSYGFSIADFTAAGLIQNADTLKRIAAQKKPGIGTLSDIFKQSILAPFKNILSNYDQATSSIKINRNANNGKGALEISAIGITHNQVLSYSLEGWTGRYSMPLEFLLATHIATMAPDLSYKLATNFNTDVEILLYKAANSVEGGIKCSDGTIIAYKDFKEEINNILKIFNDNGLDITGLDELSLTQAVAYKLFEKFPSLKSRTERDYKCTNPNGLCSDGAVNSRDMLGNPQSCNNCQQYLQLIYRAVIEVTEHNFDIFVPYINSVTDHWFRDVYFTYGAMEQENVADKGVIVTDEEYYLSTGEMWTNYELDENGDYELYVYAPDKDGNYTGEFAENGKLVCRETAGGSFGISKKAANMYEKKTNGGYELYLMNESNGTKTYTAYSGNVEEFRVGKKAITEKKKKGWNAYKLKEEPKETGWEEFEITEDSEEHIQQMGELEDITLVYNLSTASDITQVEDGVRGETNVETKKLFLDDYYLYDGSGPRAALIEEAKTQANSDDPDTFRKNFGSSEIVATYKGKDYTATIDDISGPINILQNSLTAFSILRNMHTLDAEYIYHDFKELIVELDYFDKEDLIESEREVMMFPIDGISSAGWPVTRYDKNEEFYGTLIHSAQDYETKRQETIEELAELFGEEVEDEGEAEAENLAQSNPNAVTTDNLLVKAAADIMSYMQQNDYAYCQGNDYHSDPKTAHPGRSCYRASSFEDSQQPGHNLIDCSGFVSWCLQEVGILSKGTLLSSSTISSATALAEYYTSGRKSSYTEYNPGTILIYDGHVSIYAGNGVFYDAGSTNCMKKSPLDISGWHPASSVQGYIEIPNDKMTYNGVTGIGTATTMPVFDGYQGGETVLAPVTGEVIKYGTVSRKNIETEQDEEVGFIKIRVLGDKEALPGSKDGCTYFSDAGYNYFWEEYVEAGITNHVLYIEGFDVSNILTDIDTDASVNGKNIEALKNYIEGHKDENNYSTQYEVPRLADEEKMETLEKQEVAKEDAAYVIEQGNKIYIKEGAVIGHTYTQDKVNMVDGVGNYMRLIFRDVDDQVVENVENYIEIDEVTVGTGVYAEGSEIEFMAGVLTAECGGSSEEGMTAAAWVIRNRVESGRFGNSLAEVLVAKNQFEVVSTSLTGIKGYMTGNVISIDVNGTTYYVTEPTDKALEIAQKVMNGELANPIGDRLFWKSADTDVDQSKDPIQIPAGTGNKYHY